MSSILILEKIVQMKDLPGVACDPTVRDSSRCINILKLLALRINLRQIYEGYSRFWRVKRIGRMSDVLGAVKHSECQTGQEISGR